MRPHIKHKLIFTKSVLIRITNKGNSRQGNSLIIDIKYFNKVNDIRQKVIVNFVLSRIASTLTTYILPPPLLGNKIN